jgi:hypothetical protein
MECDMSPAMFSILAYVFVLVLVFIAWLKYREHLHRHRHEHGPHGSRTNPWHSTGRHWRH